MKRRTLLAGLSAVMLTASLGLTLPAQAEDEMIYGRELMTERELAEHRARMRSFSTEQEREMYRLEHHQRMQERAHEQGKVLPDQPGPRGKGMGMGPRDGSGMGQGQGQGPRDGNGGGQRKGMQ
ncbi:MAG: hypothetical protein ACLGH6_04290 [Gammaproteobacteria bacterium]